LRDRGNPSEWSAKGQVLNSDPSMWSVVPGRTSLISIQEVSMALVSLGMDLFPKDTTFNWEALVVALNFHLVSHLSGEIHCYISAPYFALVASLDFFSDWKSWGRLNVALTWMQYHCIDSKL